MLHVPVPSQESRSLVSLCTFLLFNVVIVEAVRQDLFYFTCTHFVEWGILELVIGSRIPPLLKALWRPLVSCGLRYICAISSLFIYTCISSKCKFYKK